VLAGVISGIVVMALTTETDILIQHTHSCTGCDGVGCKGWGLQRQPDLHLHTQ
jgi:hypothetical protein